MVRDDGWLGAVALHRDDDIAAVGAHPHLHATSLAAEPTSAGELQLDVLQFDVIHAVDKTTCSIYIV